MSDRCVDLCGKVSDILVNKDWRIPLILQVAFPTLCNLISKVEVLPRHEDKLVWMQSSSGKVSTSTTYDIIRSRGDFNPWCKFI